MTALTEKYRPRRLSDVVGQTPIVESLRDFVAAPFAQVFMFHGASGVGKTSAALAMARELDVQADFDLIHIKSGEHDGASVESALSTSRRIGVRNGWKLILCDEADMMSAKARSLWLSAIEDVQSGQYGKTVIIFTTNDVAKFDARFRDRCECLEFESSKHNLIGPAREYMDRLWTDEAILHPIPDVSEVKGLIVDGRISFRRIARFVESEGRRVVDVAALRRARLSSASRFSAVV